MIKQIINKLFKKKIKEPKTEVETREPKLPPSRAEAWAKFLLKNEPKLVLGELTLDNYTLSVVDHGSLKIVNRYRTSVRDEIIIPPSYMDEVFDFIVKYYARYPVSLQTFPAPKKEGAAMCQEFFKLDVTEKLCEVAEKTRDEKVSQVSHIANVTDRPPRWVKDMLQDPERLKIEDIAHLFYKFGYRVQLVPIPYRDGWMPDGEKPTNPPRRR